MKFLFLFIILLIVAAAGGYLYYVQSPQFTNTKRSISGQAESMTINSSAFKKGGAIPAKYTCDGENISPPFAFNAVPYGAKSLVLIMEDPDSPTKNFTHWVIYNINPYSTGIEENFISDSVTLGANDFGQNGYGGPCPQSGTHRYIISLYAIDTILLLPRGSTKAQVMSEINGHIIEQAQTYGTYGRK